MNEEDNGASTTKDKRVTCYKMDEEHKMRGFIIERRRKPMERVVRAVG
jgi:hypothetical protein